MPNKPLSAPATALDIQHFLKPLSLLVRCTAMLLRSTMTKYYSYISWFMNLLSAVKVYIHTFWILVSRLRSDQSESTAPFMISNLWIVPGFILLPCIYFLIFHCHFPVTCVGRESSVGTATRCGLDGPGIESRWGGRIFCTHPDQPWGPTSLLYNGYRVFPGGKVAGAWRWPPNPI
jgi:hypothetical protein